MATKYHNLSEYDAAAMPDSKMLAEQHYGIVVADWNDNVTFPLLEGALETLIKHGVLEENIEVWHVPGTFELTYAAKRMGTAKRLDAIIVIGCVIQGDTPHFDFVCRGATQGVASLNADHHFCCPVIFSVLTTNTLQQALDRAGGSLGNKGVEGAITAIKMANLPI